MIPSKILKEESREKMKNDELSEGVEVVVNECAQTPENAASEDSHEEHKVK